MEKLAEELSKLFNVSTGTIENIIQNYPKLRGQMVINCEDKWSSITS